MKINKHVGQRLRDQRERKGFTLARLSQEASVGISTINAIENATVGQVKDKTFQKITDALKMSPEQYDQKRLEKIRVGFGACLWATPLLRRIVKEPLSDNGHDGKDALKDLDLKDLELYCYYDDHGAPYRLTQYNQHPDPKHNRILTANETLRLLQEDMLDIAFLPIETSDKASGIVRIARCMNTVKGGVCLLIIGKDERDETDSLTPENPDDMIGEYKKLDSIKEILTSDKPGDSQKCCFVFPLGTIAEIEINSVLFEKTYYSKHAIESLTSEAFDMKIEKMITEFFKNQESKYFVYAGWDYNIERVEKLVGKLQGYRVRRHGSFKFSRPDHPFAQVSYDCVTLESKRDYVSEHPGLHSLFLILGENIKLLNLYKHSNNNPLYRQIADFLGMDISFVNRVLQKINWEFLIYPEMYDRSLR